MRSPATSTSERLLRWAPNVAAHQRSVVITVLSEIRMPEAKRDGGVWRINPRVFRQRAAEHHGFIMIKLPNRAVPGVIFSFSRILQFADFPKAY